MNNKYLMISNFFFFFLLTYFDTQICVVNLYMGSLITTETPKYKYKSDSESVLSPMLFLSYLHATDTSARCLIGQNLSKYFMCFG